ncbi:MAG: RagB/SusD family nutrient uptake outer membrane protein, partial [Bacteroidales bacterium]|nr:RagB/SusD family nutrient uptake outer membrane protein [Bacteroidales bacterium]
MKSKFLLWILAGVLASCDYLDIVPDQVPTMDNIFADRNTTLRYLNSCYWALPFDMFEDSPAYTGSMELVVNRQNQNSGILAAQGLNSASSGWFNHWSGTSGIGGSGRNLYAGIRECNVLIDNVNNVEDLTVTERRRMIAEAKTIKAYNTFYLLRQYGPVCLMRVTPPVGETGGDTYRNKVDDCFQYVMDLLDEVIESKDLPVIITDKYSELGRFTHAAACMLKARVLLYRASPFFNGNTEYHNFLDHNREPFFNQEYDPARWQHAVDACRAAVDACAEGDIHLYGDADYKPQYSTSDTTRRVNVLRSAISEDASSNQEIIFRHGLTAVS